MVSCPQCNSQKVVHDTILDEAECEYCTHTFYPVSITELQRAFARSTTVELPVFKHPLKIREVGDVRAGSERFIVYLVGQQDGEYRLKVYDDKSAALDRRKNPSEQRQFGSKWKTVEDNVWIENLN